MMNESYYYTLQRGLRRISDSLPDFLTLQRKWLSDRTLTESVSWLRCRFRRSAIMKIDTEVLNELAARIESLKSAPALQTPELIYRQNEINSILNGMITFADHWLLLPMRLKTRCSGMSKLFMEENRVSALSIKCPENPKTSYAVQQSKPAVKLNIPYMGLRPF